MAALTAGTLPLFTSAAFADIGDQGDPDPLSPLEAVLIYGGIVVGVFLLAVVIVVLSGRRTSRNRYRPGRPWSYDPVWFGRRPEVERGQRPRAARPGAGGASGRW